MMTFMSGLKGYKRKNAWNGGGSKLTFHKDLYLLGTGGASQHWACQEFL